MKKLLLVLLFVATSANAAKWFEANNTGGGKIVLFTNKCEGKESGQMMLAYLPGGKTVNGCWWFFGDKVHVIYKDGDTYTYDPNGFVMKSDEGK
jgi:hypothetical protein